MNKSTILPRHRQQPSPSHCLHHNQHHHLSVAGWQLYIFNSLLSLHTATKIYLQYFCWKKKIGDTLFSEADCSKLPPLINNTERHRESERHRERQILTCFNWNNISHHTEVSYHSHQHGPVSLCASACPPFPHIFAHSSLPPISSGQSVA